MIAAHAAREAGDRPRAGEALSRAARQMVHLGRPDDALDLMQLATVRFGGREPCRGRGRCCAPSRPGRRRRWGAGQATRRTLGEAEDLFVSDNGPTSRRRAGCSSSTRPTCTGCRPWPTARWPSTSPPAAPRRAAHAERGARPAGEGAAKGPRSSTTCRWPRPASSGTTRSEADRYARLALVSIGETSSHRTWDRLREMYRLTGRYAGLRGRSTSCATRSRPPCRRGRSTGAARACRPSARRRLSPS